MLPPRFVRRLELVMKRKYFFLFKKHQRQKKKHKKSVSESYRLKTTQIQSEHWIDRTVAKNFTTETFLNGLSYENNFKNVKYIRLRAIVVKGKYNITQILKSIPVL